MTEVSAVGDRKVKVFISYSRKDEDFAQELLAGLQLVGFEPYLDKHDIAAGEDWEQRLGRLIEAADTVVFVISPDAMASDRCAWEVNRTVELKKRLLPIVFRRVEEAQVPPRLKQLNYVFFDRPFSFALSLQALATALQTDLEWIREHTRIGELALRWHSRGQVEALLLRGEELSAAKTWLAAQPQYAPEPTLLHHQFIKAGEDAEAARASVERKRLDEMTAAQEARATALQEREFAIKLLSRRTTLGISVALLLTVAAIGMAYWGYDAERRVRLEQANAKAAAAKAIDDAIEKEASRLDIKGQLTAYAAEPGEFASDNFSYSQVVLKELPDQNISFQIALARGGRRMSDFTAGKQRPYLTSNLNGDVFLYRHSARQKRTALVVAVDKDPTNSAPLPGVRRDADGWVSILQASGIKVTLLKNPTSPDFDRAFAQIIRDLSNEDGSRAESAVAFVVFAGVGLTKNREEMLTFSDFDSASETVGLLRLREIKSKLQEAASVSILFLDTNFIEYQGGR
jgi:hypothetical protein